MCCDSHHGLNPNPKSVLRSGETGQPLDAATGEHDRCQCPGYDPAEMVQMGYGPDPCPCQRKLTGEDLLCDLCREGSCQFEWIPKAKEMARDREQFMSRVLKP